MSFIFKNRYPAILAVFVVIAVIILASSYYGKKTQADERVMDAADSGTSSIEEGAASGILTSGDVGSVEESGNTAETGQSGETGEPGGNAVSDGSGSSNGENRTSEDGGEEPQPSDAVPDETPRETLHDFTWQFYTYSEPSFEAPIVDSLSPRTVSILEIRSDGWARIHADGGESWAHLERNVYFINRKLSLYTDIDGAGTEPQNGQMPALHPPQLVEISEQRDNWIKILTSDGYYWINTEDRIRQTVLLDIPALDQRALGYPLGCEMVALTMLINYEFEARIQDLVDEMPRADHPDEGFRGEPASSSRGWTIFPPALAGLMVKYVGNSYDMSGGQIEDLKAQLNDGKPVMVWVRGLGFPVHALCLTGYNRSGFLYNDPWTGGRNTPISYSDFYAIWNDPIIDNVLGLTYEPRKAMSYR